LPSHLAMLSAVVASPGGNDPPPVALLPAARRWGPLAAQTPHPQPTSDPKYPRPFACVLTANDGPRSEEITPNPVISQHAPTPHPHLHPHARPLDSQRTRVRLPRRTYNPPCPPPICHSSPPGPRPPF